MNKVVLCGKAGSDAEEKREGFVTFRLATTEAYKNKEGSWEKATEWHSIVCGSFTAKKAKDIKKGDDVLVEGKIKTHEYNNQRYTQIEALSIQTFKSTPKPSEPRPFSNDELPF